VTFYFCNITGLRQEIVLNNLAEINIISICTEHANKKEHLF